MYRVVSIFNCQLPLGRINSNGILENSVDDTIFNDAHLSVESAAMVQRGHSEVIDANRWFCQQIESRKLSRASRNDISRELVGLRCSHKAGKNLTIALR